MSSHHERVIHGSIASEHLVQLFDEPESLVEGVSSFLVDAWKGGEHMLVVARPANWALTSAELQARGFPVTELTESGRLVVLDAATTLAQFMVSGDPDPEKFRATVGALVTRLCSETPDCLAVYGEMVDILAAQGNYVAAEKLEALWNQLSEDVSFRLLCGYSSAHFGDERTSKHLQAICGCHTSAAARPRDLLATWLLSNRRSKFHLNPQ